MTGLVHSPLRLPEAHARDADRVNLLFATMQGLKALPFQFMPTMRLNSASSADNPVVANVPVIAAPLLAGMISGRRGPPSSGSFSE
jgi:hypothetical protein